MGFPQKARFCSTNTPAQHALQPRPSLQPAASRMTQWCAGSPQVGPQGGTRADRGALQGEVDGTPLFDHPSGDQPPHLHGAQMTPAGSLPRMVMGLSRPMRSLCPTPLATGMRGQRVWQFCFRPWHLHLPVAAGAIGDTMSMEPCAAAARAGRWQLVEPSQAGSICWNREQNHRWPSRRTPHQDAAHPADPSDHRPRAGGRVLRHRLVERHRRRAGERCPGRNRLRRPLRRLGGDGAGGCQPRGRASGVRGENARDERHHRCQCQGVVCHGAGGHRRRLCLDLPVCRCRWK